MKGNILMGVKHDSGYDQDDLAWAYNEGNIEGQKQLANRVRDLLHKQSMGPQEKIVIIGKVLETILSQPGGSKRK